MLYDITLNTFFHIILIFGRFSAMFSLLPAIGDNIVISRVRVVLSIATSILLYPILEDTMPRYTESLAFFAENFIHEIFIGCFLGVSIKIFYLMFDIIGVTIAMQSGLGSATFFDPSQASDTQVFSRFLLFIITTAIFVTDTHHIFIEYAVDSYRIFPVSYTPSIGDISEFISKITRESFVLSFKMLSPFLVVSVAMLLGSGVLSRLMPNLQVFFVLTPAQTICMYLMMLVLMQIIIEKATITLQLATKFYTG